MSAGEFLHANLIKLLSTLKPPEHLLLAGENVRILALKVLEPKVSQPLEELRRQYGLERRGSHGSLRRVCRLLLRERRGRGSDAAGKHGGSALAGALECRKGLG